MTTRTPSTASRQVSPARAGAGKSHDFTPKFPASAKTKDRVDKDVLMERITDSQGTATRRRDTSVERAKRGPNSDGRKTQPGSALNNPIKPTSRNVSPAVASSMQTARNYSAPRKKMTTKSSANDKEIPKSDATCVTVHGKVKRISIERLSNIARISDTLITMKPDKTSTRTKQGSDSGNDARLDNIFDLALDNDISIDTPDHVVQKGMSRRSISLGHRNTLEIRQNTLPGTSASRGRQRGRRSVETKNASPLKQIYNRSISLDVPKRNKMLISGKSSNILSKNSPAGNKLKQKNISEVTTSSLKGQASFSGKKSMTTDESPVHFRKRQSPESFKQHIHLVELDVYPSNHETSVQSKHESTLILRADKNLTTVKKEQSVKHKQVPKMLKKGISSPLNQSAGQLNKGQPSKKRVSEQQTQSVIQGKVSKRLSVEKAVQDIQLAGSESDQLNNSGLTKYDVLPPVNLPKRGRPFKYPHSIVKTYHNQPASQPKHDRRLKSSYSSERMDQKSQIESSKHHSLVGQSSQESKEKDTSEASQFKQECSQSYDQQFFKRKRGRPFKHKLLTNLRLEKLTKQGYSLNQLKQMGFKPLVPNSGQPLKQLENKSLPIHTRSLVKRKPGRPFKHRRLTKTSDYLKKSAPSQFDLPSGSSSGVRQSKVKWPKQLSVETSQINSQESISLTADISDIVTICENICLPDSAAAISKQTVSREVRSLRQDDGVKDIIKYIIGGTRLRKGATMYRGDGQKPSETPLAVVVDEQKYAHASPRAITPEKEQNVTIPSVIQQTYLPKNYDNKPGTCKRKKGSINNSVSKAKRPKMEKLTPVHKTNNKTLILTDSSYQHEAVDISDGQAITTSRSLQPLKTLKVKRKQCAKRFSKTANAVSAQSILSKTKQLKWMSSESRIDNTSMFASRALKGHHVDQNVSEKCSLKTHGRKWRRANKKILNANILASEAKTDSVLTNSMSQPIKPKVVKPSNYVSLTEEQRTANLELYEFHSDSESPNTLMQSLQSHLANTVDKDYERRKSSSKKKLHMSSAESQIDNTNTTLVQNSDISNSEDLSLSFESPISRKHGRKKDIEQDKLIEVTDDEVSFSISLSDHLSELLSSDTTLNTSTVKESDMSSTLVSDSKLKRISSLRLRELDSHKVVENSIVVTESQFRYMDLTHRRKKRGPKLKPDGSKVSDIAKLSTRLDTKGQDVDSERQTDIKTETLSDSLVNDVNQSSGTQKFKGEPSRKGLLKDVRADILMTPGNGVAREWSSIDHAIKQGNDKESHSDIKTEQLSDSVVSDPCQSLNKQKCKSGRSMKGQQKDVRIDSLATSGNTVASEWSSIDHATKQGCNNLLVSETPCLDETAIGTDLACATTEIDDIGLLSRPGYKINQLNTNDTNSACNPVAKEISQSSSTQRCKRGRPRKSLPQDVGTKQSEVGSCSLSPSSEPPAKRKRGRPRRSLPISMPDPPPVDGSSNETNTGLPMENSNLCLLPEATNIPNRKYIFKDTGVSLDLAKSDGLDNKPVRLKKPDSADEVTLEDNIVQDFSKSIGGFKVDTIDEIHAYEENILVGETEINATDIVTKRQAVSDDVKICVSSSHDKKPSPRSVQSQPLLHIVYQNPEEIEVKLEAVAKTAVSSTGPPSTRVINSLEDLKLSNADKIKQDYISSYVSPKDTEIPILAKEVTCNVTSKHIANEGVGEKNGVEISGEKDGQLDEDIIKVGDQAIKTEDVTSADEEDKLKKVLRSVDLGHQMETVTVRTSKHTLLEKTNENNKQFRADSPLNVCSDECMTNDAARFIVNSLPDIHISECDDDSKEFGSPPKLTKVVFQNELGNESTDRINASYAEAYSGAKLRELVGTETIFSNTETHRERDESYGIPVAHTDVNVDILLPCISVHEREDMPLVLPGTSEDKKKDMPLPGTREEENTHLPLPGTCKVRNKDMLLPSTSENKIKDMPLLGNSETKNKDMPLQGTSEYTSNDMPLSGTNGNEDKNIPLRGTSEDMSEDMPLSGTSEDTIEHIPLLGTNGNENKNTSLPGTSGNENEDMPLLGTGEDANKDMTLPGTSKDDKVMPLPSTREDENKNMPLPGIRGNENKDMSFPGTSNGDDRDMSLPGTSQCKNKDISLPGTSEGENIVEPLADTSEDVSEDISLLCTIQVVSEDKRFTGTSEEVSEDKQLPGTSADVSENSHVPITSEQVSQDKRVPGTGEEVGDDRQLPSTIEEVSEDEQVPDTSEEVSEDKQVPGTSEEVSENRHVPITSEQVSEDTQIPVTSEEVSEDRHVPGTSDHVSEDKQLPDPSEKVSEDKQVPGTSEDVSEDKQLQDLSGKLSEDDQVPGISEDKQVPVSSEDKEVPGTSEDVSEDKQVPSTSEDKQVPGSSEGVSEDREVSCTSEDVHGDKQVPCTSEDGSADKQVPCTSEDGSADKQVPCTSDDVHEDKQVPCASEDGSADKPVPGSSEDVHEDKPLPGNSEDVHGDKHVPGTSEGVSEDREVPCTSEDGSADRQVPGTNEVVSEEKHMPVTSEVVSEDKWVPVTSEVVSEDRQVPGTSEGVSEDKHLPGTSEDKPVAGTSQDKQVPNTSEDKQVAGTSEDKQVPNTSEDKQVAGTSEDKQVAGTSEDKQVAGTSADKQVADTSADVYEYKQGVIKDRHEDISLPCTHKDVHQSHDQNIKGTKIALFTDIIDVHITDDVMELTSTNENTKVVCVLYPGNVEIMGVSSENNNDHQEMTECSDTNDTCTYVLDKASNVKKALTKSKASDGLVFTDQFEESNKLTVSNLNMPRTSDHSNIKPCGQSEIKEHTHFPALAEDSASPFTNIKEIENNSEINSAIESFDFSGDEVKEKIDSVTLKCGNDTLKDVVWRGQNDETIISSQESDNRTCNAVDQSMLPDNSHSTVAIFPDEYSYGNARMESKTENVLSVVRDGDGNSNTGFSQSIHALTALPPPASIEVNVDQVFESHTATPTDNNNDDSCMSCGSNASDMLKLNLSIDSDDEVIENRASITAVVTVLEENLVETGASEDLKTIHNETVNQKEETYSKHLDVHGSVLELTDVKHTCLSVDDDQLHEESVVVFPENKIGLENSTERLPAEMSDVRNAGESALLESVHHVDEGIGSVTMVLEEDITQTFASTSDVENNYSVVSDVSVGQKVMISGSDIDINDNIPSVNAVLPDSTESESDYAVSTIAMVTQNERVNNNIDTCDKNGQTALVEGLMDEALLSIEKCNEDIDSLGTENALICDQVTDILSCINEQSGITNDQPSEKDVTQSSILSEPAATNKTLGKKRGRKSKTKWSRMKIRSAKSLGQSKKCSFTTTAKKIEPEKTEHRPLKIKIILPPKNRKPNVQEVKPVKSEENESVKLTRAINVVRRRGPGNRTKKLLKKCKPCYVQLIDFVRQVNLQQIGISPPKPKSKKKQFHGGKSESQSISVSQSVEDTSCLREPIPYTDSPSVQETDEEDSSKVLVVSSKHGQPSLVRRENFCIDISCLSSDILALFSHYKCMECSFTTKCCRTMGDHVFIHCECLPFKCGHCNRPFSSRTGAYMHHRRLHPDKKRKVLVTSDIDIDNTFELVLQDGTTISADLKTTRYPRGNKSSSISFANKSTNQEVPTFSHGSDRENQEDVHKTELDMPTQKGVDDSGNMPKVKPIVIKTTSTSIGERTTYIADSLGHKLCTSAYRKKLADSSASSTKAELAANTTVPSISVPSPEPSSIEETDTGNVSSTYSELDELHTHDSVQHDTMNSVSKPSPDSNVRTNPITSMLTSFIQDNSTHEHLPDISVPKHKSVVSLGPRHGEELLKDSSKSTNLSLFTKNSNIAALRRLSSSPSRSTVVQTSEDTASTSQGSSHQPLIISVLVQSPAEHTGVSSTSTGRYVCTHCMFSDNDKDRLIEHLTSLHADDAQYTCSKCDSIFSRSREAMEQHLTSYHSSGNASSKRLPDFYDIEEWRAHQSLKSKERDNIFEKFGTELDDEVKRHYQKARAVLQLRDTSRVKRSAEADSTTSVLTETVEIESLTASVARAGETNEESELTEPSIAAPEVENDDSNEMGLKIINVVSLAEVRKQLNFETPESTEKQLTQIDNSNASVDRSRELHQQKCQHCEAVFITPARLFVHLEKLHGENCWYSCPVCKDFLSKADTEIYQHIDTRHSGNSSDFIGKLPVVCQNLNEYSSDSLDSGSKVNDDIILLDEDARLSQNAASFIPITSSNELHVAHCDSPLEQLTKASTRILDNAMGSATEQETANLVTRNQAMAAIKALKPKHFSEPPALIPAPDIDIPSMSQTEVFTKADNEQSTQSMSSDMAYSRFSQHVLNAADKFTNIKLKDKESKTFMSSSRMPVLKVPSVAIATSIDSNTVIMNEEDSRGDSFPGSSADLSMHQDPVAPGCKLPTALETTSPLDLSAKLDTQSDKIVVIKDEEHDPDAYKVFNLMPTFSISYGNHSQPLNLTAKTEQDELATVSSMPSHKVLSHQTQSTRKMSLNDKAAALMQLQMARMNQSKSNLHQSNTATQSTLPIRQSTPTMHQPNRIMNQVIPGTHHSTPTMHQSTPIMHQPNLIMHQSTSTTQSSSPTMYQSNQSMHQPNRIMHQANTATHQPSSATYQSTHPMHQSTPTMHQSSRTMHQSNRTMHHSNPTIPVSVRTVQSNPTMHHSNLTMPQSNITMHQSKQVMQQFNLKHRHSPVMQHTSTSTGPIHHTATMPIASMQHISAMSTVPMQSRLAFHSQRHSSPTGSMQPTAAGIHPSLAAMSYMAQLSRPAEAIASQSPPALTRQQSPVLQTHLTHAHLLQNAAMSKISTQQSVTNQRVPQPAHSAYKSQNTAQFQQQPAHTKLTHKSSKPQIPYAAHMGQRTSPNVTSISASSSGVLKCAMCSFATTLPQLMQTHITNTGHANFRCPYCPSLVPLTQREVPIHIRNVHPGQPIVLWHM